MTYEQHRAQAGERCCKRCQRWFPETDEYFIKRPSVSSGKIYLSHTCKLCYAAASKARYEKNAAANRHKSDERARRLGPPRGFLAS